MNKIAQALLPLQILLFFCVTGTICNCEKDNRNLILGGYNAETSRFPYFAGLLTESGHSFCGGTLVAPDLVLSAAHCWKEDLHSVAIGGNLQEVIAIESTTVHYGFTQEVLSHDIMMIKLASPTSKTPIQLNFDATVPAQKGAEINVIGIGLMDDDNGFPTAADTLQQVSLNYAPNKECSHFGEKYHNFIQDDMICADGSKDVGDFKGWYEGDSGGPLIILGESAEEDVQVGVVSFSALGYPGVGSRTSANESLIRDILCGQSKYAPAYLGCTVSLEPKESFAINGPSVKEIEVLDEETIKIVACTGAGALALVSCIALLACRAPTKKATLQKSASFESTEEEGDSSSSENSKDIIDSISAIAKDTKKTDCDDKRVSLHRALKTDLAALSELNKKEDTEPVSVHMSPRAQRKNYDDALDMVLDIMEDMV